VIGTQPTNGLTPAFLAPSLKYEHLACGWYGVGHTARRHPGDMRGTVIGKKGRFRFSNDAREEVMSRA
jgi:hypothetical protein